MFRKIFTTLLIASALIFVTSGCSSDAESAEVSKPATYSGEWKMINSDPSFNMNATISKNNIEITWISDDTKALYWKGTFPVDSSTTTMIVSKADKEALAASLLGSQDPDKTFTYEDGVLSFEMSVLGVTKTIELEK